MPREKPPRRENPQEAHDHYMGILNGWVEQLVFTKNERMDIEWAREKKKPAEKLMEDIKSLLKRIRSVMRETEDAWEKLTLQQKRAHLIRMKRVVGGFSKEAFALVNHPLLKDL